MQHEPLATRMEQWWPSRGLALRNDESGQRGSSMPRIIIHCESKKNWATFIFTVTLANVGRFLKFFRCRNQKEMAHNKNEKFPTVA